MEFNRTKNSIAGIFWGTINKVVGILGPFLTRTILIYILGDEYSGLNSVFFSILSVLNLAELGFGSAVVYSMYEPIAHNDYEKIYALLNLYKKIYRILGSVIAIIGILLIPWLHYFISGTYPTDISLIVVYLVYLFNTVISYLLFAYKNSLLNAYQRIDIISNISTSVNIIMYIFQIWVLIFLKSYYAYLILIPLATITNNLVTGWITNKVFPQYIPSGNLKKTEKQLIYHNVKALIGHKIGGTIVTSADSIIISAFLGLKIVAYYNNYQYITSAIISLIAVLVNSILGGLGNRLICKTKEENLILFYNLNFGLCWIVGWCSICLMCLYQPFMMLWMGEERLLDIHIVILIVVYFYSWQFRVMGLSIKDAAGMWKQDFWKPYVGAIINIILNLVLIQVIGLAGVLISTIIDLGFVYFPWETNVIFNNVFCINPKKYYLKHIYYLFTTIIACIITYLFCSIIGQDGIRIFLIKAIICIILPNIIYIISYRKCSEVSFCKQQISNVFNTIIKRKSNII